MAVCQTDERRIIPFSVFQYGCLSVCLTLCLSLLCDRCEDVREVEAVVRAFCALDHDLAAALVGHYFFFSLSVPLTDPGWLCLTLRICRCHDLSFIAVDVLYCDAGFDALKWEREGGWGRRGQQQGLGHRHPRREEQTRWATA